MTRTTVCPLESWGVLRFAGPDARRFLQGQLSHDLGLLGATRPLLAGLHNPQGRVLAILRLQAADPDVLAALPAELIPAVKTQLERYILRAKLRIEDASAESIVYGVADEAHRALHILPRDAPAPAGERVGAALWHLQDIVAGRPQVYAATSGKFIAQMLNLDLLDAVSFTKGCYTGQEIIARTHYLGRAKRRMQRFIARPAAALHPADRRRLRDRRRRAGGWTVGAAGRRAAHREPCGGQGVR